MKRIVMVTLAFVVVAAISLGGASVLAAKPQPNGSDKDVIAMSNGFPSGEHHNLNIHGMKEGYICEEIKGGNSIRVSLDDTATIQYVSNKKSSVLNLTVLDPCAVDGGTAKVQLPYERDGYFVFARILGTPNNNGKNKDGDPSRIILYPNVVVDACNWNTSTDDEAFGANTSCDEIVWPLGVIVGNNLYGANPANATFERFDPVPSGNKGKGTGRSKGMDITRLFTYTGWVADASLDIGNSTGGCLLGQQDGILDNCDVPLNAWTIITDAGFDPQDYDPHVHYYPSCDKTITWGDLTPNGIDIEEWLAFQEDYWQLYPEDSDSVACNYYCEEFILNIADLVVTEQGIVNQGAKLLQIRFYPVETTLYD